MSRFKNPSINEIIDAIHCDRKTYDRNGNACGWYKDSDLLWYPDAENSTIFIAATYSAFVRVLKSDSTHKQIAQAMNLIQTQASNPRKSQVYAFRYVPSDALSANASDFKRIDVLLVGSETLQQDTPDEIFKTLLYSDEFKAESYAAQVMPYMYNNAKTRVKAVKRAKEMLAEIARGERIEEIELPAIEF